MNPKQSLSPIRPPILELNSPKDKRRLEGIVPDARGLRLCVCKLKECHSSGPCKSCLSVCLSE